ncbi:MAG: carboxypeptidase M32 [Blastopirellula sp.]|nr:MAG: carboxypeptidase M32 [Blastopirellula sp.]
MPDYQATYKKLCEHYLKTTKLTGVSELIGWDERTMLPSKGGEYRAEQITILAGILHERNTDARIGDWLSELADSPWAAEPHSDQGTVIRQLKREYEKETKLPQRLVEELSKAHVLGQQAWVKARAANDFKSFAPVLEQIVSLAKEVTEAIGYEDSPYDALLDFYEPEAKTSEVTAVLAALKDDLVPLVAEIADSGKSPDREIMQRKYPIAAQEAFGKEAAAAIGFDFEAGRLDVTHHPFCCGMGPYDCRITTRYDENFFPSAFFGIMHETGHGLYEQGLRKDCYGLPPGKYVSLGIHESQSRLWENCVGRSKAFWDHFFPAAQNYFPEALADVTVDQFQFGVNDVRPSLIRVEADEVTYNLHIIIRFELEQALIDGSLQVKDLPGAWNEKYQSMLGISSPDDADGCLQDVHWGAGLIGYFPTYSLGNIYSAQLYDKAGEDLGNLDEMFARGEFLPLLDWLRTNIHESGQNYRATELVENVTGKKFDHKPLIRQLRAKLAPLYGIQE